MDEKNQNPTIKNGAGHRLLNGEQQLEIVKMLAEFHTVPEIQYEMEKKYRIKLAIASVLNYKTADKWQVIFQKYRKKFTDAVDDVPGAHKRIRMERMERIWERTEEKGDIKNAISVTEHQRKEIEGEGNKHQGDNILIQFNGMSDDELNKELQNTIEYIKKLESKKVIEAEVVNVNG